MSSVYLHNKLCKAQTVLKRNAPAILSGLGALGVVGTAISAVKATPKAMEVLNQQDEELTTFEKAIVLTPVYFPTILMGTATIGCILGANAINKKNQAMLVSAYSYLDSSFKEYKDKVKDIFGEEGETRVEKEIKKRSIPSPISGT